MKERNQCIDARKGLLISAYELGLLNDTEKAAFEDHLTQCAYCLESLYEMSSVSEIMTSHPRWIDTRVDTRVDGETNVTAEESIEKPEEIGGFSVIPLWRRLVAGLVAHIEGRFEGVHRRYLWAPLGALAAAAVLLVVLLTPGETPSVSDLARVEPIPYAQLQTRGGGASDAGQHFQTGMTYYTGGRYEDAAAELILSVQAGEREDGWKGLEQAYVYLGVSLLLADRPGEARSYLNATASSSIRPVAERAKWYLAQMELILDNSDSAEEYLGFLADSSIGYSARAKGQLLELRSRRAQ